MNPRYSITKNFGEFPAAHRQPFHQGHCAQIHGHNWSFIVQIEGGPEDLDGQGFLFDFGQFGDVKEWLRQNFDHTLLLQTDDPQLEHLTESIGDLSRIVVLDSVSCEGIAKFFYDYVSGWLRHHAVGSGTVVASVTVTEDLKNSATYVA